MKKHTFKVDKLVRDKILQNLKKYGIEVHQRLMNDDEFKLALNKKLVEEVTECEQAQTRQEIIEEIGDVLEVIYALAKANNIDLKTIEQARLKKLEEKGGFEQKVFCTTIDVEETSPKLEYYRAKYFELK